MEAGKLRIFRHLLLVFHLHPLLRDNGWRQTGPLQRRLKDASIPTILWPKQSQLFQNLGFYTLGFPASGVTLKSQLASTNQGKDGFENGVILIGPIFWVGEKTLQMYPIPSMGLVYLPTFT